MAIKLGGSGGGANIPYKGSTAEVSYLPVTQGSYYNLDSTGKLTPADSVLCSTRELDQDGLAQANGGTGSNNASPFYNGTYEGQMPNGNVLYAFQSVINNYSMGISLVVLDEQGLQLTYAPLLFDTLHYTGNLYNIRSAGEDSSHYIFTVFTKGQSSSNNDGRVRGYTVTVRKSDNVITVITHSALAYSGFNTSAKLSTLNTFGGIMDLARDKSVYCAIAVDVVTAYNNCDIEITTGTVSATYANIGNNRTNITDIYRLGSIQLIKYDDSSANFLLIYQVATGNTTTGFTIKKVLVAADGSHTVTDITPSGVTQGNGTGQLHAEHSHIYKSEQIGKYLWACVTNTTEARYQKLSYDGSTITAGSYQQYLAPSTGSADRLFRSSGSGFAGSSQNSGSLIYRYTEDKIYIAPKVTNENWSNYQKGAVWTLGSGSVQGTAVQTDLFDLFIKQAASTATLICISDYGIITERYTATDPSYVIGQTQQVFDTNPITTDKIAYARQSGAVGATVDISLIEGITSSDTLSSSYFLSKEDMYYPFSIAEKQAPSFGYLKPTVFAYQSISSSVINAVNVGSAAFTITAPEGKYIKILTVYASSNTSSAGMRLDGRDFGTRIASAYSTAAVFSNVCIVNSVANPASSSGPSIAPPFICKEFNIIRQSNSNESSTVYVSYMIGEPA
tara:strand:+ start:4543 stop:6567 length:2025 start_codon:yes stop_codon:yes gene_type:complete